MCLCLLCCVRWWHFLIDVDQSSGLKKVQNKSKQRKAGKPGMLQSIGVTKNRMQLSYWATTEEQREVWGLRLLTGCMSWVGQGVSPSLLVNERWAPDRMPVPWWGVSDLPCIMSSWSFWCSCLLKNDLYTLERVFFFRKKKMNLSWKWVFASSEKLILSGGNGSILIILGVLVSFLSNLSKQLFLISSLQFVCCLSRGCMADMTSVCLAWIYSWEFIVTLWAQSRPNLCDYMDCSPPGSSVLGISQARILERVAISSSRESSPQGANPCLLCLLHYRQILYLLSHWESPYLLRILCKSVLNWQFSPGWNTFCLLQTLKRERLGTLSFVGNGFWESSAGWLHLTFRLWFHADTGSPTSPWTLSLQRGWPSPNGHRAHFSVLIWFALPLEFDVDHGCLLEALPSWFLT